VTRRGGTLDAGLPRLNHGRREAWSLLRGAVLLPRCDLKLRGRRRGLERADAAAAMGFRSPDRDARQLHSAVTARSGDRERGSPAEPPHGRATARREIPDYRRRPRPEPGATRRHDGAPRYRSAMFTDGKEPGGVLTRPGADLAPGRCRAFARRPPGRAGSSPRHWPPCECPARCRARRCLPPLPDGREDTDVPGPSWLAGTLAAVMIAIAVYCAARLVASRLSQRKTEADADAVHGVMGVAMAGMLLPWLNPPPSTAWEVVFGTAAAWFAWQAARARSGRPAAGWQCPYPVPHLIECGTMLYMLLQVRGAQPAGPDTGTAMPGMAASPASAGSFPVLALILALFTRDKRAGRSHPSL
jgi:Domain of unknown function (DUF5134)